MPIPDDMLSICPFADRQPADSQVSEMVAQIPPSSGEDTMSMKSHQPRQRPGPQFPRCTGFSGGLDVDETKSGLSLKTFVEISTYSFHGRRLLVRVPLVVPGNVMAIFPASPAVISGKLTSCTPGGATIIGWPKVRPWSFEIAS